MNGIGARKVIPAGPSVYSTRSYGPHMSKNGEMIQMASQLQAQTPVQGPSGKILLEGWKQSIDNNFEGETPWFSPVSAH
jgi:hypothetical protein